MALAVDFKLVLTSSKVPETFQDWLVAQDVLSIKNFANVASTADLFELDVIAGCNLRFAVLGAKSAIRFAWAVAKAAHVAVPSNAAAVGAPVAEDAPLAHNVLDALLKTWLARC